MLIELMIMIINNCLLFINHVSKSKAPNLFLIESSPACTMLVTPLALLKHDRRRTKAILKVVNNLQKCLPCILRNKLSVSFFIIYSK